MQITMDGKYRTIRGHYPVTVLAVNVSMKQHCEPMAAVIIAGYDKDTICVVRMSGYSSDGVKIIEPVPPPPIEAWVNVYEINGEREFGNELFHFKEDAEFASNKYPGFINTIKVTYGE